MTGLSAEVSAPPVAADQHSFSLSVGGLLINIDKGGTLNDFCVIDGANVYRTKVGGVMAISYASTRTKLPHLWAARTLRSIATGCVLALPRSTARSKRFRKSRTV